MWPFKKEKLKSEFLLDQTLKYKGYDIRIWVKQSEGLIIHPFDVNVYDLYFDCGWSDSAGGGYYNTGISSERFNDILDRFISEAKQHIDFIIKSPEVLKDVKTRLEKFK